MKVKLIALLVAVVVVGALVAVAARATGAYFSDTHSGQISGTIGSIKVDAGVNADMGGGLNFGFTNLLPGEPQSGAVYYQNSGTSPEDVWVVFNNPDALHALNDLGTYGSVAITSSGGVNWVSNNLNDFYPSGTPGEPGVATLYYVPEQMLLQSNVAPGASGWMRFAFAYAGKLTGNGPGVWNAYPAATATHNGETYTAPGPVGQYSGLPYQIVATQVGQTPHPIVLPPLTPAPIAPW